MAYKICETLDLSNDEEDIKIFTAQCACLSPDHTQDLEVCYNKKFNELSVKIYSKIFCDIYYDGTILNWIKCQLLKLKYCYQILTQGYISADNEFLLDSKQQVKDYIDALSTYLQDK